MSADHKSKITDNPVSAVRQQFHALRDEANELPMLHRLPVLAQVDEFHTAQKNLYHQFNLLQAVLQASPLGVFCLDPAQRVSLWNAAAEATLGWRADEVIGQPLPIICREDEAESQTYFAAVLAGEIPPPIRICCQRKTGQPISASLSASPLSGSTGAVIGATIFLSEISEHARPVQPDQTDDSIFRHALEQSTDGFVLLNDQGQIVEWNAAQEAISGIPRQQAIGQDIWDIQYQLMLPDQRTPAAYDAAKRHVDRLLRTRTSAWLHQPFELPFQRPDGTRGTLQTKLFVVQTRNGFMVGGIIRDVTQQRRTEEALRESEERFHAVFDSAQDAIYIKNRDLVYTHANPVVEKQNNRTAAEIIGKTAEDLFESDPAVVAKTRDADLRVLAGEVVEQIVTRPTGGIPRTYHNIKVPIRNKSGDIIGLCAVARDVTERERAADVLKENEERYRALVDNSPVGIFVIDDDQYIFSNPAGAKLLGLASQDDIIGMRGLEPIVPVDRERILQIINEAPGQIIPPIEIYLKQADGSQIAVESTSVPIRLNGRIATLVISQDVTERKLAQERALALIKEKQHSQLLTEFIQNVSHEFRTPLSIINTSAYLLSKMADSPSAMERIQQLGQQTEYIAALINAMLTMSSLDSGVASHFDLLDINQIIETILYHVGDEAEAKGLNVQFEPTPWPTMTGDQDILYQGLLKIIENAINFTEAGGAITAHVLGEDDQVTVTVADTGIGITAEDLPHVFERFYRTDKARSTHGAGLGLSIARKVVELHQGTIDIGSAPGQGTIVTMTFPRRQA